MSFLTPNQQCQSTEGILSLTTKKSFISQLTQKNCPHVNIRHVFTKSCTADHAVYWRKNRDRIYKVYLHIYIAPQVTSESQICYISCTGPWKHPPDGFLQNVLHRVSHTDRIHHQSARGFQLLWRGGSKFTIICWLKKNSCCPQHSENKMSKYYVCNQYVNKFVKYTINR